MRNLLIAFLSLAFAGCNMTSMAPMGGAVVGGGTGALLGGPAGGAIGAGLGYGAGKLTALASENKDLVKAITEKDVQALLEAGMGQQKGFIEEALDTIYGFIKLCLIGVLIYTLAPILYTRYILRKVIKDNGKDKKAD